MIEAGLSRSFGSNRIATRAVRGEVVGRCRSTARRQAQFRAQASACAIRQDQAAAVLFGDRLILSNREAGGLRAELRLPTSR